MEFELLLIIILFVFIFLSLVIYKYVENEKINKLKNKENNNYIVEKIFIEDIVIYKRKLSLTSTIKKPFKKAFV